MNQDPIADDKAAKLQWRHGLEQRALEAGQEYTRHTNEAASWRQLVVEELMPAAAQAGIPFDTLAKLVGVSRQTLYRWREVANQER